MARKRVLTTKNSFFVFHPRESVVCDKKLLVISCLVSIMECPDGLPPICSKCWKELSLADRAQLVTGRYGQSFMLSKQKPISRPPTASMIFGEHSRRSMQRI